MHRSDYHGLVYLAKWGIACSISGMLVWFSIGTFYVWPAMFCFGVIVSVPAYSLSHETAHGTAFRTRWLNEIVFWFTSLLYGEEPLHRRYTHTNHHTHTWYVGLDSQMPFDTPLDLKGWISDTSGFSITRFQIRVNFQLATKQYTDIMLSVVPKHELPKLTRNARIFIAVYSLILFLVFLGYMWPIWFLVLPRILGYPIMLLFNLIQHVEMAENSPSIIDSTRSFRTNLVGKLLYLNMNNHIEHHLYPQVPFYSLPKLHQQIADQIPEPDPGFWRTNYEVLSVVIRRFLGQNTKARNIRQAPHMVTNGSYAKIAKATMR